MDLFLEELIKKLNQRRQEKHNYGFEQAVQYKGLHNHNILRYELFHSELFKVESEKFLNNTKYQNIPNNAEVLNNLFLDIQQRYNDHREYLLNNHNTLDQFKPEHLNKFHELLCEHANVLSLFHEGLFHFHLDRTSDELYDRVINGYKYVTDPENNELVYFQDVMNGAWTLIHLNLPHEAIIILNKIGINFDAFLRGQEESIFEFTNIEAHIPRMAQSLDWAFAWAYRQLGNDDIAAFYLNQITSRHIINNPEDRMEIFWHTGKGRILEAAVELYKLQPTEENKIKILSIIVSNYEMRCDEPNESLREMLYAIWSASKTLFNKPL